MPQPVTLSVTVPADWWLKDPLNSANNMIIDVLPAFTTVIDEAVARFEPLGRPHPVVISDVVHGQDGQLKIMTIGETAYQALKILLRTQHALLLQSPWSSEQWYIRITSTRSIELQGWDINSDRKSVV